MSKRSAPEIRPSRTRLDSEGSKARLLQLAGAVADGGAVDWSGRDEDRVLAGLRVIADLSERLGTAAHRLPSTSSQTILFQWGHLDVLERIGAGASSEVFRAYDPLLAIEVALKLSRPGLGWAGTGEWIGEARRLARLRHPNIVAVHGVDCHDGRAGLWLDLVKGESLDSWGRRQGPLSNRELCLVGIELCRGLAAIHEAGLLHCDLKPANLLRSHDGRILIADFGAAASAHTDDRGIRRGTPLAMAPEVLAGVQPGIASDLYGLGVVLYWLASGEMPVQVESMDELAAAHRAFDPRALRDRLPIGFSESVFRLLVCLLEPEPHQRPADATEIERLLAAELTVPTAPVVSTVAGKTPTPAFERVFGREAELAYLQQEYRRALGGQALPVLLVGESGTGKSALAAYFGAWLLSLGSRLLRLSLAAGPGGARLPTLLVQAVSRAAGSAGVPRARADDPVALAGLIAGSGPLVLCLDDLHRCDAAEWIWLRRLSAALRGSQVLLLGLLRTSTVQGPDHSGLLGDVPVAVLRLRAFSAGETTAMIAELLDANGSDCDLPAGLCGELHRLSGGNPFFLSELVRHLVASGGLEFDRQRGWCWRSMPEALPPSLELAALQRCRALPEPCQAALEAAAVLGDQANRLALATILGLSVEDLDEALAPAQTAGVLEPGEAEVWSFRHGLIRRALYHTIAPERRRELHHRCVAAMAAARDPQTRAALSVHAQRAGDTEVAFSAGYAALPVGDDNDALADLVAYERLQELLDAGVRAGKPQRWRIALGRLRGLRLHGRLHEAQALADRTKAELQPRAHSSQYDALCLERAQTWFALGRYRCVLTELAPLLAFESDRRRPARNRFQAARLLAVRAQAALGEYRQAEANLLQALSNDPGSRQHRLQLQTMYGWCIALQGLLEPADEALQRALDMAAGASTAIRADILRRLHWVRLGRGRYQDAHALAMAAHDIYRSIGDAIGQAKNRMALAQVRLSQGLTEEAMGYLNRAGHELEDIGDRHCEAETRWLLARAEIRLGGHEQADAHLDQALDLIVQIGDRDDEFRFLTERARLRLAQGRPEQAAQAAENARSIAVELDSRDGEALADVEYAAAELAQGRAEAALARTLLATQQLHAIGSGECWRGDWLLGRCHLELGNAPAASTALASAQNMVDRIVAEFDRRDRARRARLRQSWQPLVDDHARALDAAGRADEVGRLRRRWTSLEQ